MTIFCDFDECVLDAAERRGLLCLCLEHAREHDAMTPVRGLCDYDDCNCDATERRDEQQWCADHAREHDDVVAAMVIDQALLRQHRLDFVERHLEAAQAALRAWFADTRWTVYLEAEPLGLRLERSARTVGEVELRPESDVRALAHQLVDAVEAAS